VVLWLVVLAVCDAAAATSLVGGGSELGEHMLELGAGPGAATEELRLRAGRVTSLEYDHRFAARLGTRVRGTNATVIQGDAAILPFPDNTFTSAIAILMLHHLRSNELQDRAFAEVVGCCGLADFFLPLRFRTAG